MSGIVIPSTSSPGHCWCGQSNGQTHMHPVDPAKPWGEWMIAAPYAPEGVGMTPQWRLDAFAGWPA